MRLKCFQIAMLLTFEIFERAKNHRKKFLKLRYRPFCDATLPLLSVRTLVWRNVLILEDSKDRIRLHFFLRTFSKGSGIVQTSQKQYGIFRE